VWLGLRVAVCEGVRVSDRVCDAVRVPVWLLDRGNGGSACMSECKSGFHLQWGSQSGLRQDDDDCEADSDWDWDLVCVIDWEAD